MTSTADKVLLEQQLLESEQRYQAFTELTSDFCHVCSRTAGGPYHVEWIGGQFERITGYSNDELLALGCWLPLVHPDDRERIAAGLLRLTAGDEVSTEFRLVRKDQSVRWIREHSKCVQHPSEPDQLLLYGSARDITTTREATLALQAAESAYRTIFNATNDTIFIQDPRQGMIIDCNKQALELFGRPREELIGANPVQLSPPDHPTFSPEQARRYIQAALEGEPQLFEWLCARPDGTTFWAEVSLRAAEINGRQRLLAVVRDITQRKQAALELQRTRDAAQAATIAKNEFLANMSHEVRTPLNGIMGLSQLLRTTNLTEEQAGYMDMLDGSARNLLALINDILDISKIEAGSLAIQQIPFSLSKLLREVAGMYEKLAAEKGIDFAIQQPDDLPPALVGDPLRLKQVLINLVGNAIKFTRQGVVSVHIHRLHNAAQGSRLRFEVRDSGIGMTPETLQKIFHPFTQADASTARIHGGSGLGLAICRRLSELMGGSIRAESRLGQGSRFIVELPFGQYAGTQDDDQPEVSRPPLQLGPLTILLVEDQEVNRTFVQRLLERQGYRITPAADGLMALDLLEREPYDLVLLDIQMPGMGGEEVLARLRQGEQTSREHLPVIALTAHALAGDRERLLESGFDGYISKPVQMDQLLAEMGRVVAMKGTFHT
jgi:PAS domain S-box-containing protein